MIIKGYRVGPLLKRVGSEILDDNLLGLSAQTAYYFFFSLFPLFLFIAPLLGVFGNKERTFALILGQLSSAVPGEAFKMVEGVLKDVMFSPSAPGAMSIGALLALWAGSNIFNGLIDALNRAYEVTDKRPWWKKRLLAVAAVIVAGGVMLSATTVLLAGEDIARGLSGLLGLGETGQQLWTIMQFPIAFAALVGLAWLVYYFLPNVRQSKKTVFVGALAATSLWLIVTLLFRFYVQNFGSYNKTYGAIGGVIVLLTWMFLSMLVLLIGGELISEIHHGAGSMNPRKGATVAGRIAVGTSRASTDRIEPLKVKKQRD